MRSIFSLAVLCPTLVALAAQDCAWSNNGVTFDLSMLQQETTQKYSVVDIRNGTNDPNHDFSYVFNVCGNTEVPFRASTTTCAQAAPAFQMQPRPQQSNDNCQPLGAPVDAVPFQFNYTSENEGIAGACTVGTVAACSATGLPNPDVPGRGVVLSYMGGSNDGCQYVDGARVNRSFSLHFECAADPDNTFDGEEEPVWESNSCHYDVFIQSIYGCPTQCTDIDVSAGRAPTSICSGHGICAYDTEAIGARCLCNDGYDGARCESRAKPVSNGMSPEGVVLVIMVLILVGVIGLVAYMGFRLRNLQVDPSAMEGLDKRFNELGQMA